MTKADSGLARRLAWVAIALYLAGLGIAAVLRTQGDFKVYYRTGAALARGANIYDFVHGLGFLYAPILAVVFVPFAMLPLKAAQGAWFVVNGCAVLALLFGASRLIFRNKRQLPGSLVVLPVLLSSRFIDNNIEHGQINIIAFALIAWALVLAEEERAKGAGAMLGAALLIKPFALLGALYLLLRRRLNTLGWTLAAVAALLVLPSLYLGPAGAVRETAAYFHAVTAMTGRYRMRLTNQSAVSAVARLIDYRGDLEAPGSLTSFLLGTGIELALIAAVSWWILVSSDEKTVPSNDRPALCALFCIMASFAPVSWKHYYVVLLIPYMELLSGLWIDKPADEGPSITAWLLLVLSIVLNLEAGRALGRLALFYSAHFVSSLVLMAALFALWRARRAHAQAGCQKSVEWSGSRLQA